MPFPGIHTPSLTKKITWVGRFSKNSCQVFNDLDKVVDCCFLSISGCILDHHLLGNFRYLVTAQVQKGLDRSPSTKPWKGHGPCYRYELVAEYVLTLKTASLVQSLVRSFVCFNLTKGNSVKYP